MDPQQQLAQLLRQLNPAAAFDPSLAQLLAANGITGNPQQIQRLAYSSSVVSPFGSCNFFDRCTDELMSLHYWGRLPLLDWMGFNVTEEYHKVVEFISFVRPTYATGTPTIGYIADPCADPNGVEFGTCKLTVDDFGRYGRMGPVRKVLQPKFYCKTDPKRRLDGTLLTDEREWDMRLTMDALIQDIMRAVITGNKSTPGQFDGLEQWVNTGYDCSMLDSLVVDWNHMPMSGGTGVSASGAGIDGTKAIGTSVNIIEMLLAGFRRIRERISWSQALSTQQIGVGDMILVMPSFLVNCLLDFFTCWRICDGSQYNETVLQTYEARNFRNSLMGGMFGAGKITLDNIEIPIMPYDHGLIKGPTTGDMYFLTNAIGNERIWSGEFLNADQVPSVYGGSGYFSTDSGRVLGLLDQPDNLCIQMKLWMHLRLFNKAPWTQMRFMNVKCSDILGPLSSDPLDSSFYPLSSFAPAVCL